MSACVYVSQCTVEKMAAKTIINYGTYTGLHIVNRIIVNDGGVVKPS